MEYGIEAIFWVWNTSYLAEAEYRRKLSEIAEYGIRNTEYGIWNTEYATKAKQNNGIAYPGRALEMKTTKYRDYLHIMQNGPSNEYKLFLNQEDSFVLRIYT